MDGNKPDLDKETCLEKTVTPAEAYSLIKGQKEHGLVIVDVRTPEEFRSGSIEGAINMNFKSARFGEDLEKLDKKRKYIVYCAKGIRSCKTAEMMAQMGFSDPQSIEGGIESWKKSNLPLVSLHQRMQ